MITARRPDGSLITRNSSHFRRLPPHITTPSDVTESDAPESETPPPEINVSEDVVHAETCSTEDAGDINTSSNQLQSPSTRRSGRETKTPTHPERLRPQLIILSHNMHTFQF